MNFSLAHGFLDDASYYDTSPSPLRRRSKNSELPWTSSELLVYTDEVLDTPPSPRWIPAFAACILHITRHSADWEDVVDRFEYMAERASHVSVDAGLSASMDNALAELVENLTDYFPPCDPLNSNCIADRLPSARSRDNAIGASVIAAKSVNIHGCASTAFTEWIYVPTKAQTSASLVSAVLGYHLFAERRPVLYSFDEFVDLSSRVAVVKAHYELSSECLLSVFGRALFGQIAPTLGVQTSSPW